MLYGYMDSSGVWRPKTRISDTASIYRPKRVLIEDNVFIGHYTILDGTGGLEIGEGTQISSWAGLFTHSSHVSIRLYGKHYQEVPEGEKKGFRIAPVRAGKYVFIGLGAKILYGTTIGDGVLVSPGSIVRGEVEPFAIVSGAPAEVIGDTRDLDRKYLQDPQLKGWYDEWLGS
jgi:acetyltransferase-like isoleucine patch superfamily enzyme